MGTGNFILYDEVLNLLKHICQNTLYTVQTLGVNGWFPLNFLLCLVVCPPSSLFVPSVTNLGENITKHANSDLKQFIVFDQLREKKTKTYKRIKNYFASFPV